MASVPPINNHGAFCGNFAVWQEAESPFSHANTVYCLSWLTVTKFQRPTHTYVADVGFVGLTFGQIVKSVCWQNIRCLILAKGSLNGGLEPTASTGQQKREVEADISLKVRAWLTLAILSSELLLAFNITMVSQALVSALYFLCICC